MLFFFDSNLSDFCGCVEDTSYQPGILSSLEDVGARDCGDALRQEFNPTKDCDCPTTCNDVKYDFTSTPIEWPRPKDLFLNFGLRCILFWTTEVPEISMLDAMKNYNNGTLFHEREAILAARSVFGRFNVYFSDLSTTVITERPVYNFAFVASNFGGLLGLYLVFSVFTILEDADLGFEFIERRFHMEIFCAARNQWQSITGKTQVEKEWKFESFYHWESHAVFVGTVLNLALFFSFTLNGLK